MFVRLQPARVVLDAGVPFSPDYGDVYTSRDGALGQARHVFLGGNALPERWRGREQFVVLETGFGLGTSFLATWQAWRDDPARPRRLHFVSIEKHPVEPNLLTELAPAELRDLAQRLAARWPPAMPGLHRLQFDDEHVVLTLALGDAPALLPELVLGADAVYLDGFAPDRNPQMWEPALLKAIGRAARPEATLSTWCTARDVRDGLVAAGFDVELRPGFAHKRQMLVARFAPRWRVRRAEPPAPYAGERRAVVVGAGLAGAACADALARRGWSVTVLDRSAAVPGGASALPWGIAHPQLTADDSAAARLTRAGFFATRQALQRPASEQLAPWPGRDAAPEQTDSARDWWRACGLLQLARDATEAEHWQRMIDAVAPPPSFAQFVDAPAGSAVAGVAVRHGGIWFPGGLVIGAGDLCRRLLAQNNIGVSAAVDVTALEPARDGWTAMCAPAAGGARSVAITAPVAIVATALTAPRLLASAFAPVTAVRGRLSLVDSAALAGLRVALGGLGYLVRAPWHGPATLSLGATYEVELPGAEAPLTSAQAAAANRRRLDRLLADPAAAEVHEAAMFDADRCVARDRLPLAGHVADEVRAGADAGRLRGAHLRDLPRRPGLYTSFALGSRGLTVAPLIGEWIAAQIEGEPWPIERDLAARIDTGRFLLDALRHGRVR